MENYLGEGTVGLVKRGRSFKNDLDYAIKIVRTNDEEMIMNVNNYNLLKD